MNALLHGIYCSILYSPDWTWPGGVRGFLFFGGHGVQLWWTSWCTQCWISDQIPALLASLALWLTLTYLWVYPVCSVNTGLVGGGFKVALGSVYRNGDDNSFGVLCRKVYYLSSSSEGEGEGSWEKPTWVKRQAVCTGQCCCQHWISTGTRLV